MPKYVHTESAPKPFSNYSQAVELSAGSRILHVSGQVGAALDGTFPESEEEQHELAWRNVLAILKASGMTARNLVDCHVYITRPESIGLYRRVRDRMLEGAKPAATLLVVAGLADPKLLVEIAAVAAAD
ncbi:MAG: RidA family protein [Pseudomonadota bacterium]|nr:RidA family protein [Pseudomonadota bacterium]